MMKAIILDFDGTIFRLFANYDLEKTKEELRSVLDRYGIDFPLSKDSFDVFSVICSQQPTMNIPKANILSIANDIIISAECDAIQTGIKINGFEMFIQKCKTYGVSFGIASNNSSACIETFCKRYGIPVDFPILGRDVQHIERMKPNPWILTQMTNLLDSKASNTLLIGDTITDYLCAKKANIEFIGMATNNNKELMFQRECPSTQIVSDFVTLGNLLFERDKAHQE